MRKDFSGLHAKVQLSVVRIHVKPDTVEMQDSSERGGIVHIQHRFRRVMVNIMILFKICF